MAAALEQAPSSSKLLWPLDCVPGKTCVGRTGYPDLSEENKAFDCGKPAYKGHQGTDISISQAQMDAGVDVYAAADGEVLWVFDGKYDRCPSDHVDCQAPEPDIFKANLQSGYRVCTSKGRYCSTNEFWCYWCFDGGNVVVIKHDIEGIFATRYDHLKKHSIVVKPGDIVSQGDVIAQVGSAGRTTGPHLHFEVWGKTYYDLVDPWQGHCSPEGRQSLWQRQAVIEPSIYRYSSQ